MANENKNFDRREFMSRCGKAGAVIGVSSVGAYLLLDKKGPTGQIEHVSAGLPDYSVPKVQGKTIAAVKSPDRTLAIEKALDLLGGIERFVKEGDVVLIKPNIAFASAPVLGATTNPQTLSKLIQLCYDRGKAKHVIVTDNPINDPQSCFTFSGLGKAATESGAQIILPKKTFFESVTLENGQLIRKWPVLTKPFEKVTKLIGVTPIKDHHRSGASMTMKNWYGLLGGKRGIFHQAIHQIISELATMVKPTFVVLDGSMVMKSNGPTGGSIDDLVQRNTMIVSTDMVAADTYGAGLLDMSIDQLPFIGKAQSLGIGSTDFAKLGIMEASI